MITNDLAIRYSATISDQPAESNFGTFKVADDPAPDVVQRTQSAASSKIADSSQTTPSKPVKAVVFSGTTVGGFVMTCLKVIGTILERIADFIFYPSQRYYTNKQARVAVQIREETEVQQKKTEAEKVKAEELKKGMAERGQVKLVEIAQRRDQRLLERNQAAANRAAADARAAGDQARQRMLEEAAAAAAAARGPALVQRAALVRSAGRGNSPTDGEFLCTVVLEARARLAVELAEVNAQLLHLAARATGRNGAELTQYLERIKALKVDQKRLTREVEKATAELAGLNARTSSIPADRLQRHQREIATTTQKKDQNTAALARVTEQLTAEEVNVLPVADRPAHAAAVKLLQDRKERVETFAEAVSSDGVEGASEAFFAQMPVLMVEHAIRSQEAPSRLNTPEFFRASRNFGEIEALFNRVLADNRGPDGIIRNPKTISLEREREMSALSSAFTRNRSYSRDTGWDSNAAVQDCIRRLAEHEAAHPAQPAAPGGPT